MVQLRDDILEEVTRLYFERKRLSLEVRQDNISQTEAGKTNLVTGKALRIEELTAYIDALTGGEFSKALN